jgi:hypothetical protein
MAAGAVEGFSLRTADPLEGGGIFARFLSSGYEFT